MLRPIKTESQYEDALERIYALMQMDLVPDSNESDELEVLSVLVKKYENEHYPVPQPHPIEAIKFRLDQMGMTEKHLSKILGYRIGPPSGGKSAILSGKRKLSLSMIRKLHEKLKIPAEVLIQDY